MLGDKSKQKEAKKPTAQGEQPNNVQQSVAVDVSKSKNSPLQQKRLKLGLIALAAVLLLGVIAYFAGARPDSGKQVDDNSQPAVTDAREEHHKLELERLPYEELQQRVHNFELTGQYDEAEQLIRHQDYYESEYEARMLLVTVLLNAEKYEEALEAIQKVSDDFGIDAGLAEVAGDTATETGDKDLARYYYEEAIDLLKEDSENPLAEADIEAIEEKIEQLER